MLRVICVRTGVYLVLLARPIIAETGLVWLVGTVDIVVTGLYPLLTILLLMTGATE